MTVNEDREALAAEYVLGTLDADERARVELMLETDPPLRDVGPCLGKEARRTAQYRRRRSSRRRISGGVSCRGWTARRGERRRRRHRPDQAAAALAQCRGSERRARREPVAVRRGEGNGAPSAPGAAASGGTFRCRIAGRQWLARLCDDSRPEIEIVLRAPGGRRARAGRTFLSDVVRASVVPGWATFTRRVHRSRAGHLGDLAQYPPDIVNDATYAVSIEPLGGSPTGSPTGPVPFHGKLIEVDR